jgi:hypothetical protein
MSGETEQNVSGWTVDTLHETFRQQLAGLKDLLDERYATQTKAVDAAFDAQQIAMQTALGSAEKAVTKAEIANEKRFDQLNGFRGMMADQAATLMPRVEAEQRVSNLSDKIDALVHRVDNSDGKGVGLNAAWGYIVGAGGFGSGVIAVIYTIVVHKP